MASVLPSAPARIGLFGGSFDPVHHGHLILAQDALAELSLDRLVFLPAYISPHKLSRVPTAGALRRAMLEAALGDEPRFVLDPRELSRPGPSFAIDTVLELRSEHPAAQLIYLLGADNLPKLHTWHRIADLHAAVQWAVFGRGDEAQSHPYLALPRRVDISSTEIRQRVASGRSIQYLVPEPVRRFIEEHHLYQDTPPSNLTP